MSAPKPPTPQKINPYAGVAADPRINRARQELGMDSIENDDDMRKIQRYLLEQDFETERGDENFRLAERQLMEEGLLTNSGKTQYFDIKERDLNDKQRRLKNQYLKKHGDDADWRYGLANMGRSYDDQQDMQRVFDRVYEIETEQAQAESDKVIKKQTNKYNRQQKKAAKANRKMMKQMQADQIAAQERSAEQQREMMEEMMNQPVYSAKAAALPTVQAKPRMPEPRPVAPAPPPQMSISPAPAPELVNIGNPMGIVRQSQTARSRSRQRTKGTSSLT